MGPCSCVVRQAKLAISFLPRQWMDTNVLNLIFLREDIEATTWKEFILGMSQQEWIHEVESTAVAW